MTAGAIDSPYTTSGGVIVVFVTKASAAAAAQIIAADTSRFGHYIRSVADQSVVGTDKKKSSPLPARACEPQTHHHASNKQNPSYY